MAVPKAYRPTEDVVEAYNRCNPNEPLRGEALEHWYVDCAAARGATGLQERLVERVQFAREPAYGRALLAGHQGCGKSTELQQVRADLEGAGYWPLLIEAHTEVTPDNLDTEAIVSIVLKAVVEQLGKRGVKLNQKKLQEIARWFALQKTEVKEFNEAQVEAGAGAEAKANALVFALSAMFKAHIKRGSAETQTLTEHHRRYLSDLVDNLGDVLRDAHLRVRKQTKQDTQLVLIIDGLDRIKDDALQNEVFITYRELLDRLAAHLIMTVPIDLVCSSRSPTVEDTFGMVERMPSIDVEDEGGYDKTTDMITRRCDAGLFDPGVLEFICRASGGDVRHIFIMAREAILRSRPRPPVTMEGARGAYLAMAQSFSDWLQPEQYAALAKHHGDPEDAAGRIAGDVSGDLLLNSALLCYSNGQRWYRVHPAICGMPDHDLPGLKAFESQPSGQQVEEADG